MNIPDKIPPKGFYYHYKHDPRGPVNNYAYELIGVGCHTEQEGVFFAIYLPLYGEAPVFKAGKLFDLRPLTMWMETVTKDGIIIPRFTRIVNSAIIAQLEEIRRKMYE